MRMIKLHTAACLLCHRFRSICADEGDAGSPRACAAESRSVHAVRCLQQLLQGRQLQTADLRSHVWQRYTADSAKTTAADAAEPPAGTRTS